MSRNIAMYKERHELLKTFTGLGMPPSKSLELIQPMETMTDVGKEAFAKALRMKLENDEISV